MKPEQLISLATEAMKNSYAPYSSFNVGAALLTKTGKVYQGCNIENSAYSPTNCAERTAFFKAISEGEKEFSSIAIVGGYNGKIQKYSPPCGVCRQVMLEFCDKDNFNIFIYDGSKILEFILNDLIPYGFDLI